MTRPTALFLLAALLPPAADAADPPAFRWVNPPPQRLRGDDLVHGTFDSKIAGEAVGFNMLLPPAYAAGPERRFPVVYYLHGGRPGSESKGLGLVPTLRREFAAGAEPVIYVFVNGGPVSHYNVPPGGDYPAGARGRDVFLDELIPHMDATFRTLAGREHRGLEGFSQGGRGTARIGLTRPDLFASIAPGGAGFGPEARIRDNAGEERPGLVFAEGDNAWDALDAYAARGGGPTVRVMIWVGTKGYNYRTNRQFMRRMTELGVPFESTVVDDVGHSARDIYERSGRRLMDFHAAAFAATP